MENLLIEKISQNESFESFKIKKNKENKDFILAIIFKEKKINKNNLENLNIVIKTYNQEANSLYLDIINVDSIHSNIMEQNVLMIKELENNSSIKKVAICGGKLTKIALKTLLKIKKPKIKTKIFEKEQLALNFLLN